MNGSDVLRQLVETRAYSRCEYCLIHHSDVGLPHEVDHVISRKHGGVSQAENLAYACYLCNRYKGSDIASLDPATQDWCGCFTRDKTAGTNTFGLSDRFSNH